MKKIMTLACMACIWILPSIVISAEINSHEDTLSINPALTLSQVLQKALEKYPQQFQLNADTFNATARKSMADALLPSAPALSLYHQNDTLGSGRNERDWQAFVEIPLWLPKQRLNRTKVAELSALDVDTSRDSMRLKVAGLVRDALWNIAMNSKLVALAEQREQLAQQLEQDVAKKFKAGELAKTDLMLIQQERMQAERQTILAEAELMHARHRYLLLTGLNEMPSQYEEIHSSKENFEQSPIWLAAQAKVNLAQGERELVETERRENPQILLNIRNSQGAFDAQYNQSMGFTIRVPLDSPSRSAPMQAQAEKQMGSALFEKSSLYLAMQTDLHEAEHNLTTTKRELDVATQQLDVAREQARLSKKAFSLGESDLTSVLRIQQQALEVESTVALRQIQYQWNIARYNQAVGVLP